ncbi:sulfocyanin-like copper-binding protein [Demequina capsici]|uniref:Sulfocyanin-like copper-binding protein n=1 Tax=Demequina capsici TaxID=3075620 RepID=A0AA96FG12_9MICO|nr:sulfocyanin-like copper-binding protein [Demequina sp. PMTSA13]WNM27770.1 sulfocyanin-like copper-binding protein [Demequina sp. PMTSA13]
MTRTERAWTIASLIAAVAVLAASMAWAFGGGITTSSTASRLAISTDSQRIDDSDLPGTVVDVYAMDMSGRGMMMGRANTRMMLRSSTLSVDAGTVTLHLINDGTIDHELVILPLADGQQVGQRPVLSDGSVDESDSLGEASATNAEGEGSGITPGASGWVTLDLAPGRYELVCNIDGHYAAGMYTLLVVR